MGASKQPVKVIWDTGSEYLVLQSKECTNCKGTLYDSKIDNGVSFAKN